MIKKPAVAANAATTSQRKANIITLTKREHPVVKQLLFRDLWREEVDRIGGCSNGPALIAGLRAKGFRITCDKVPVTDRDGEIVKAGRYHMESAPKGFQL